MKRLVQDRGLQTDVISRGIYAENGSSATEEAINTLLKLYKIDISGHSSKLLNFSDIESSDIIYVMTDNHKHLIHSTLENDVLFSKIKNFSKNDIQDPYLGNKKDYEKCAKEIHKGLLKILKDEF